MASHPAVLCYAVGNEIPASVVRWYGKARVEGLPHCDWVLIDAGDVVVHLFRPEVRSFYNIEKIWSVDSPHITPAN